MHGQKPHQDYHFCSNRSQMKTPVHLGYRFKLQERITASHRIYGISTLRRPNYMSILTTDWSKLILKKICTLRIIKTATSWQ